MATVSATSNFMKPEILMSIKNLEMQAKVVVRVLEGSSQEPIPRFFGGVHRIPAIHPGR